MTNHVLPDGIATNWRRLLSAAMDSHWGSGQYVIDMCSNGDECMIRRVTLEEIPDSSDVWFRCHLPLSANWMPDNLTVVYVLRSVKKP